MELERFPVNDKITASCQRKMSPNHSIKRWKKQQIRTLKSCKASKFSKSINAIHFNLLQVCLSTGAKFLLCLLCYLYLLSCFERLFICFTRFGDGSHCLNFGKSLTQFIQVPKICFKYTLYKIMPMIDLESGIIKRN